MPIINIAGASVELPRNVALLDTNVLVAFANIRDAHHQEVKIILDEFDYRWVVAQPVIVEACGLLTSRCDESVVRFLVRWLATPGNVILLPPPHKPDNTAGVLSENSKWMHDQFVDYVDSYLMFVADTISKECDLRPFTPIATYDKRDFYRCANAGYRYSLFDMDALDLVDFN